MLALLWYSKIWLKKKTRFHFPGERVGSIKTHWTIYLKVLSKLRTSQRFHDRTCSSWASTQSQIPCLLYSFTEQIACDAHTTYFSNTSVPETDCIYSASLHSVYFHYADIILWELIIILMVFSYEYVKMNYLLRFVSRFMNYPF